MLTESLVAVLLLVTAACKPAPTAAKDNPPAATVQEAPAPLAESGKRPAGSVHDFSLETIDGAPRSLGEFRGKVLLLVNTASECGYTPQYQGLEKLHATYEARGFSVVGFPSNDFGGQEPGSNKEIKAFCTAKFGVTFPMFAKISVKGPAKHPLYAMLIQTPPAGEVKWNFNKFLVGRDGKVIARFESDVTPESSELVAAIDKALRA